MNILDEMLESYEAAVIEWKKANTPEKLQATVNALLNKNSKQIVMKLLGFDHRSRNGDKNFELDHCNGRQGESAAGDYLRSIQSETIHKWLQQIPLPELTKTELSQFKRDAKQSYKYELNAQLRAAVEDKAKKQAIAIAKEITEATLLNKRELLEKILMSKEEENESA